MGESTMMPGTPKQQADVDLTGLQSLLSMNTQDNDLAFLDDLGPFNWPETGFSPSALPPWIMDTGVTDLGMPFDGSDSIFLPTE